MDEKDNGHNEADALEQAERELNATLEKSDMDNVFTTPQSTDNIKFIMTPGSDDPLNIYMRADFPSQKFSMAMAIRDERCTEHADIGGKRKQLKITACLIGVKANRVNVVRDIMIGERTRENLRKSPGDWIREKAGYGDKGEVQG